MAVGQLRFVGRPGGRQPSFIPNRPRPFALRLGDLTQPFLTHRHAPHTLEVPGGLIKIRRHTHQNA
jgi:hypothetical protein